MSKLDEIARVAGVSRHTVGRILSGKRQERWPSKQEQGDRIRRLAEEMGYRPNASARALVLGKFGCIGLLHSTKDAQSYVSPQMLSALDAGLVEHDLHLSIARLDDNKLTDVEYVPKILREWLCDGLIINYHDVPAKTKKLISDFRIPAIWMNCRLPYDAVYADDYGAAVEAVGYLAAAGHRKIAYVDASFHAAKRNEGHHYYKLARKDGYSDALAKAGLLPFFAYDDEKHPGENFPYNLRELLSRKDRPTAIIAYTRNECVAVRIVAAELGLKIPEDVSVIGFIAEGNISTMIYDDAVMVGPETEMCKEAVEMMVRKIAQPQVEFPARVVPFSFHRGKTIAAFKVQS